MNYDALITCYNDQNCRIYGSVWYVLKLLFLTDINLTDLFLILVLITSIKYIGNLAFQEANKGCAAATVAGCCAGIDQSVWAGAVMS